jgi:hypothetical protein
MSFMHTRTLRSAVLAKISSYERRSPNVAGGPVRQVCQELAQPTARCPNEPSPCTLMTGLAPLGNCLSFPIT